MLIRFMGTMQIVALAVGIAGAQSNPLTPVAQQNREVNWRSPSVSGVIAPLAPNLSATPETTASPIPVAADRPDVAVAPVSGATELAGTGANAGAGGADVSRGSGTLPNDAGQVWREYDIAPYTSKVSTSEQPEQALIDWILRETGTEVWFTGPVGLLSATPEKLYVYHTPQMQQQVAAIVDRFVTRQAESLVYGLRLITVGSPNWRARAYSTLRPVAVQTPGAEAWLMAKEDAAVLLADLRRRLDFQEHNAPNLLIQHGQTHIISRTRPRHFTRSIVPRPQAWQGYELQPGQVDEGYTLELSPLLSLDGKTVDAVLKCRVDQVEKLVSVPVDVASPIDTRQRVEVQVPQTASWRLHERFRWPSSQVLLISCGVGASPNKSRSTPLGVSTPLPTGPARADGLLFVEFKGPANKMLTAVGGEFRTSSQPAVRRY